MDEFQGVSVEALDGSRGERRCPRGHQAFFEDQFTNKLFRQNPARRKRSKERISTIVSRGESRLVGPVEVSFDC